MSRASFLLAAIPLLFAVPAAAQSMENMPGMHMPGMTMPKPKKKPAAKAPVAKAAKSGAKKPAAKKPAAKSTSAKLKAAPKKPATPAHDMSGMKDMPGMDMSGAGKQPEAAPAGGMPGMEGMEGMDMSTPGAQPMPGDMQGMKGMKGMDHALAGTALPAGNAPAPAPATDHYADRSFPPAEMANARSQLKREHGGSSHSMVMFNLAEFQARSGRDGYRWDGEGWFGGDIDRAVVKTEGEGAFRSGVDSAEVQLLYSHAIGPYFNLQGGVRYDFKPDPSRTYATIGVEGLAPYWFEIEGALFLSNKGDVLGRAEGYYDQRITQRLILQPRVELNFSAQDVRENRIGSGLTNAELGLRLRYEIKREFAPYIGVSYDRKVGDTARFARADGDRASATSLVLGVRTWF